MKIYSLAPIAIAAILTVAIVAGVPAFAHKEHSDFVTNAEYIKGHLEQAVIDKQAGNTTLAVAHAGHPIGEVYSLMEGPLANVSAQRAASLKEALNSLTDSAQSDTPQAFNQKVAEVNGMLDEAVQVFAGKEAEEAETKAAVISNLLKTSEREYEEGVKDGKVVATVEYQDATGFISRANAVFKTVQSKMSEHESEAAANLFEQLNSSLLAKADPKDIEKSVDGIIHEVEEGLGLEVEDQEYDGQAYINNIQSLLNQTLTEYKAGNYQEAREHAVEAYLDNYEYIESDIKQDNPQLMEKIEIALSRDLVTMIDEKKPLSEVEVHIGTIRTDLEQARTVVVPEFPLATGLVFASVAAVILAGTLYTRRKGSSNLSF
jgi:hypothetical protein